MVEVMMIMVVMMVWLVMMVVMVIMVTAYVVGSYVAAHTDDDNII